MNTKPTPTRNATFDTFGGETTLIRDYQHWSVQARPAQATLGALVLLAHSDATSFADLPLGAHAELAQITADIEGSLGRLFSPQKYNYLMLMMVDPHVHFHVLPRYDGPQDFAGVRFLDLGWPALPDLKTNPSPEAVTAVAQHLRQNWPGVG